MFVATLVTCFIVGFIGNSVPYSKNHTNILLPPMFLVFLAFTMAAVGRSGVQDYPEPMFVSLRDNFVDWKSAMAAISATGIAQLILTIGHIEAIAPTVVPLASLALTPLLLIGVSQSTAKENNEDQEAATDDPEKGSPSSSSETEARAAPIQGKIYGTFTNFSRIVRRLDLRVLLMGAAVSAFDYFANLKYGHWLRSTTISIVTTAILLILDNVVVFTRDVDPQIIHFTTVALVSIFSHFNFMQLFGPDHSVEVDNSTENRTVMTSAFWFALFGMMIMINRGLEMKAKLQTEAGPPPKRNTLILDIDLTKYGINGWWQLRNAQASICLVLAFFATYCGDRFPLPFNTMTCSLVAFICIVGYQNRKLVEDETPSLPHLLALPVCALCTVIAVVVNHYDPLGVGWENRVVGAGTANTAYTIGTALIIHIQKRRNREENSTTLTGAPFGEAAVEVDKAMVPGLA